MSLYGVLRTGVSGMTAQSNKLGTVADNIANSNTTGYKRASTEFSSLILDSGKGDYNSGSVTTTVRYAISKQGPVQYTTSVTDLAVQGNGFFVVSNSSGSPYLTRAGNFVPDENGNLVNSGGFYLMGYDVRGGRDPGTALNSLDGLTKVSLANMAMEARPSTVAKLKANLPSNAVPVPAGTRPSDNVAGSEFSAKSSLVAYDNLGNKVTLDVYYTKTGPVPPAVGPGTWEVAIFNRATATAGAAGPFPYGANTDPASGAATPELLGTATLTFDASGQLTPPVPSIAVTGTTPLSTGQTVTFSFDGMQQLAAEYTPYDPVVDGNAPSAVDRVEIGKDGTMYAIYANGSRVATYKIPLADVKSPDNLMPLPGNVYSPSLNSGEARVGFAGSGGMGSIASSALEQSNVDLATELTGMIEAQRGYTANSKVFQTGSELLDVLMSLKR